MHGFSGPHGLKLEFWGQNRGKGGAILTSNELVLPFGGSYVCAKILATRCCSYRRETALQGGLVIAKSERLELEDNG